MAFELREHTADIAVEATGETLAETVAAVADGLAAASCDADADADEIPADTGDRFDLTVAAESREALLFEYLDELIYLRDVRLELPVENRVRIRDRRSEAGDADGDEDADTDDADDRWTLEGSARGVPLSEIDAREVKAVTYSEMRLEAVGSESGSETAGWEAYVVFDV